MKKRSKKGLKIGEKKENLRKKILAERRNRTSVQTEADSAKVWANLLRLEEFRKAKSVMFYASHDSEVNTQKMIEKTLKQGKIVSLPVVNMENGTITAYRVCSLKKDLCKGCYGIKEPLKERCEAVKPDSIDLVIVPGIVFDNAGGRIGYGKGYYDRWLKGIKKEKRIGLAFGFQVLKSVPNRKDDIKLAKVVTEETIYERRR